MNVKRVDLMVQRVIAVAALFVLLTGCVAMGLASVLSGFVRPRWLVLVAVLWVPAFLVLIAVLVVLRRRLGAVAAPDDFSYFGQLPRIWAMVLGTLVLIGGVSAVLAGLQKWTPAVALGPHPAHGVAILMSQGPPCGRCSRTVWVTFVTTDSRAVSEPLAAADGLNASDGAGTALVYDGADPSHVMRESDWRAGRGPDSAWLIGGGVVTLSGLLAAMVLMTRRRRLRFGRLRPGERITRVRSRRRRRGIFWRVEFGDRARTTYVDSARLRATLLARVAGGDAEVSDSDRQVLDR